MAKAHVATTFRKDTRTALQLLARSQRVFDVVGSYDQMSDFAVPEWRIAVFSSLLLARLGEERSALDAQDVAVRNLPDSLPRFATHIELHRGLMLARSGDRPEGVDYARAALAKLPLERHSLTLRVLLAEIERTLQEERD